MEDSDLLAPVPTKAALLKNAKHTEFKAQVFELPRLARNPSARGVREKRQSESDDGGRKKDDENSERPEFDMKRARHEVFNFGLTGFKSKNQKKAQIALAVKLGAKPPKKMCKNYKDLVAEKKRSKQIREERLKLRQLGKNQAGLASIRYKKPKIKKKKDKNTSGEISKHYGVVNPKIVKK